MISVFKKCFAWIVYSVVMSLNLYSCRDCNTYHQFEGDKKNIEYKFIPPQKNRQGEKGYYFVEKTDSEKDEDKDKEVMNQIMFNDEIKKYVDKNIIFASNLEGSNENMKLLDLAYGYINCLPSPPATISLTKGTIVVFVKLSKSISNDKIGNFERHIYELLEDIDLGTYTLSSDDKLNITIPTTRYKLREINKDGRIKGEVEI